MSCPVTHPTALVKDLRPTKDPAWTEAGMLVVHQWALTPNRTDSVAIRLQIYKIFIFAQTFAYYFHKNHLQIGF